MFNFADEGAEVVAFDQVVARRAILTCTNNVTRGRRLGLGPKDERLPSKGALSLGTPCIFCVVQVSLSLVPAVHRSKTRLARTELEMKHEQGRLDGQFSIGFVTRIWML